MRTTSDPTPGGPSDPVGIEEGPGGRVDVVLQRPEVLNAMNLDVFDGLAHAAERLAGSGARVVVLRGEGRSFSSGIDVTAIGGMGGSPSDAIARAQAGFRGIGALPMPTIAAIQGHAFGAGLQLALVCDLRVATDDARLGLLEGDYGLIPDLGGSTLLPRLVGPARAKRMIWLRERVTGAEAGAMGLVDVVVSATRLAEAVDDLVGRLLDAPEVPVTEAKSLIDASHLRNLEDGMDAEAAAQERCMTSEAFGETLMRGLQRRKR